MTLSNCITLMLYNENANLIYSFGKVIPFGNHLIFGRLGIEGVKEHLKKVGKLMEVMGGGVGPAMPYTVHPL
jgi:hypothetical protein